MTDDKKVEGDIKAFREIVEVLEGCRAKNEGKREAFNCNNCEYIGDCIHTISQSIMGIATWLADFAEGSNKYKKEKEEFFKKRASKKPKIPNIYQ